MPNVDRPGVGKHVLLVGQILAILINIPQDKQDGSGLPEGWPLSHVLGVDFGALRI